MGRTPPGETRGKVYRFVRKRLFAGAPPTVRDVQRALGFRAVRTAQLHLEALVKEGKLDKEPGGVARGYRIPGRGKMPTLLVPILGRVQAGAPAVATEDLEGYVPIRSNISPDDLFGLKVRGDSMNGSGILAGDVVVVRRQTKAESGEIVVALVDGEATVKRLRLRRGKVELHPENPDFKVIDSDEHEVGILGRVIEVRRSLDRA